MREKKNEIKFPKLDWKTMIILKEKRCLKWVERRGRLISDGS